MRKFALVPKATPRSKSAESAKTQPKLMNPYFNLDALLQVQCSIGNQAFQRKLQANTKRLNKCSGSGKPNGSSYLNIQNPRFEKLRTDDSAVLHAREGCCLTEPITSTASEPLSAVLNQKQKRVPISKQTKNLTGMPYKLKAGLETLSGLDLSGVRVHRNSPKPAELNALAYTRGHTIHLAPNQEKHLPHEGWHVVQQLQGRAKSYRLQIDKAIINNDPHLEAEAVHMGKRAADPSFSAQQPTGGLTKPCLGDVSRQPVQRAVRINGGRQRVNEADYLPGGSKSTVGSRYSVAALIQDNVRRVFTSVAELEGYANGLTDYIGDVQTTSIPDPFWYRLPEHDLTVLGEIHHNPDGDVEDVVLGLQTSRFMYEPYHEFTDVAPFTMFQIGRSTQMRLGQIESSLRSSSQANRAFFDPHLENIVIKALTGATVARNEFIARNPATMNAIQRQTWGSRPTTAHYSFGERIALYFSMAIHIASDLAQYNFTQQSISQYVDSARRLAQFYLANRVVLDNFMTTKDADDLIGIYNITATNNFADLPVLNDFSLRFHEYGSRYIEQLGVQLGNPALEAEGRALAGNVTATFTAFSPAREEYIWERVLYANTHDYLIAGMGDAHRRNLRQRLNAAGIRHEAVAQGLRAQQTTINTNWRP